MADAIPDDNVAGLTAAAGRLERRRAKKAFYKQCIANIDTIAETDPRLYHKVNRVWLERLAYHLGREPQNLTVSQKSFMSMGSSLLSEEFPSTPPPRATQASSLVSTLPPDDLQPQSELDQFHTAHTRKSVDVSQLQDDSQQALSSEGHQAHVKSYSHPEILSDLRILVERLTIDQEPVQTSFPAVSDLQRFHILGATHGHIEYSCRVNIDTIRLEIFFVPLKDQCLVINRSRRAIHVTNGPEGLITLNVQHDATISVDPGYWIIRDDHTSLGIQLRPCRYFLLLEVESRKRTAGSSSPAKAARTSQAHLHASGAVSVLGPEDTGKGVLQHLHADEVENLTSEGVSVGHTLVICKVGTGEAEYSLKRLGCWGVKRSHGVAFKALLRRAEESQPVPVPVIVKFHRCESNDSEEIKDAISRWHSEVKVHHGLQHVSLLHLYLRLGSLTPC